MSEITKLSDNRIDLRARLLVTASGALLMAGCASQPVMALDTDHPVVWVELGGEFTQLQNGQEAYLPPFTLVTPRLPFIVGSPEATEKNAPTSWDGNAKISFTPAGTDWVFSAGILYGRAIKNKPLSQRTTQRSAYSSFKRGYHAYQNVTAKNT